MNEIQIGNCYIGKGHPPFIIAEAGINHNGDFEKALQLIDAASEAGADAIKFQTHMPEFEMLRDVKGADYIGGSLYDLLEKTKLTEEEHIELKKYAEAKGIIFFSTPFSKEAADFLEEIGVLLFKIGSGELTNIPLLIHIAKKKKPMIISTGMSEISEIEETFRAVTKVNPNIALMQCTSTYPTAYKDVNLKIIPMLEEKFDVPVGLSDHSEGIYTALGGVALGAKIIEKHFTIDRAWPGPDQKSSIEPSDLRELVNGAHIIFEALGANKVVLEDEIQIQHMARESVVSLKYIRHGQVITEEMVWTKRPGTGIPAKMLWNVIGKRAKREILPNSLIQWDDLEEGV
jgi:N-acetylneuraminate synthase